MFSVKETRLNFFKILNAKVMAPILLLLAFLGYACSEAIIRFSSKSYPAYEIMFYRSFLLFVFVILLAALTRKLHHLKTSRFPIHMVRSFLSAGSFLFTIKALTGLSLYSYKALFLISPIFIAALGVLALKEQITKKHIFAFLTCLGAVFLAFKPGSEVLNLSGVFAICSALCAALSIFIFKKIAVTETTLSFIFYTSLACTIISLFFIDLSRITFNLEILQMFAPMALIYLVSSFCLFYGLRTLKLTSFSMINYLALPISMSLGFILWGEWPSSAMLIAGFLIILSNVVLQMKNDSIKLLKQIPYLKTHP